MKQFLPGWDTICELGRGSYGTVYEIERSLPGYKERAALKVISISPDEAHAVPRNESGPGSFSNVEERLQDIIREYTLVRRLNGNTNIVSCDDIHYSAHDQDAGYDICIRMELLTPMKYACEKGDAEKTAICVGKDISRALMACESHGILHRDIKPKNIFRTDAGVYKLGDFGIAQTMVTAEKAVAGTLRYMAPEVYHHGEYTPQADLYSLGLVLYQLLNDGRLPYEVPCVGEPTPYEQEYAYQRRFQGGNVPAPLHGSRKLKLLVLKLIAYHREDRFQSAKEVHRALEQLASKQADMKWLFLGMGVAAAALAMFHLLEGTAKNTAGQSVQATEQSAAVMLTASPAPVEKKEALTVPAITATPKPAVAATTSPVPTPTPTPLPNPEPVIRLIQRDGKSVDPSTELTKCMVGDVVTFGFFDVDEIQHNGTEPIEWQVLKKDGNRYLLMASRILARQQFHSCLDPALTWYESDMRKWLNVDFYEQAFTTTERAHIVNARLTARESGFKGDATQVDRVFLLTSNEIQRFFPSKQEKISIPYRYLDGGDFFEEGKYFTRDIYRFEVSMVDADGSTNISGILNAVFGVRPCVWVTLEAETDEWEQDGFLRSYESMLEQPCITDADVGDVVTFGRYPYQPSAFSTQPVRWIVLERDSESVLLLSEKILNYHTINTKSWGLCKLRSWLNTDFVKTAFSEQERNHLLEFVSVEEDRTFVDRVTLLSEQQFDVFLKEGRYRIATPTAYALHLEEVPKTAKSWALSTAWDDQGQLKIVGENGAIVSEAVPYYYRAGVRPCIRVRLG